MANPLNRALRSTLVPGAGLTMPGAGNALTARAIESTGRKTPIVSGAAVANTDLGVPDIGLVSLNDLVNHVVPIRNAVNIPIPILADGGTAFGNAVNTRHTVRTLEQAGANAILLEDQAFPKRCGHFENKEVISKEEMVQKIKAAVDARTDLEMMLLARTDAPAEEGLQHLNDLGSIEGMEDALMVFEDRQKLVAQDYFSDLAARYGMRPVSVRP